MRKLRVLGFAVGFCLAGGAALAADFVNLEWGEFKLAYESTVKPKSVTTLSKDGELGVSIELDSFSAGADGEKMEGSSSFAGEFVIQQPSYAKLPAMTVQIHGTMIKTAGTTAELLATIGSAEQRIEWTAEEVIAGKYSKLLSVEIKDGQLPVPFPVNLQALVKRQPGGGAVLLTVDKVDVSIGQPGVAFNFDAGASAEVRALAVAASPIWEVRGR